MHIPHLRNMSLNSLLLVITWITTVKLTEVSVFFPIMKYVIRAVKTWNAGLSSSNILCVHVSFSLRKLVLSKVDLHFLLPETVQQLDTNLVEVPR